MTSTGDERDRRAGVTPGPARILRFAPILVLLAAVLAQAVLMATVNSDRQSGSGFAMFSDVDFAGSRITLVTASTRSGASVAVTPPSSVADEVDALLISPTDDRARDLAERLATLGWSIEGRKAVPGGQETLRSVSVTVRGLTASGHTLSGSTLAAGGSQP